jgi:hypothetical protein
VADLDDQHKQALVLETRNDPIIADPILAKLSQARTLQGLAETARVPRAGHALA